MLALNLAIVVVLVAIAGFFASAETAVLAANRLRLRRRAETGNRGAARVLAFLEKPDRFLATVLLGNNISLVAATSLFTLAAEESLGELGGIAFATVVMTAGLTLFAEVIPKSVTLENADGFAIAYSPALRSMQILFAPVVWLVNLAAGGIPGRVGARAGSLPFVTREELRAILTERRGRGRAEMVQRRMIRRIFLFGETKAGDVMVPLDDVVLLSAGAVKEDVVAALTRTGFSKYAVYEGRRDNVVGVVVARELLTAAPAAPISAYVSKPLFITPGESIEDILPRLSARRVDLAVVRDDEGRALGIVTQEDIVEEVVGEIEDEYNWGVSGFVGHGRGYTADSRLLVRYFNQRMPVSLPAGDYVTLGGFLAARLGRIPVSGDVYEWPPYRFRVLRATPRAARLIAVEITEK
jgi:putative hemolysin